MFKIGMILFILFITKVVFAEVPYYWAQGNNINEESLGDPAGRKRLEQEKQIEEKQALHEAQLNKSLRTLEEEKLQARLSQELSVLEGSESAKATSTEVAQAQAQPESAPDTVGAGMIEDNVRHGQASVIKTPHYRYPPTPSEMKAPSLQEEQLNRMNARRQADQHLDDMDLNGLEKALDGEKGEAVYESTGGLYRPRKRSR